MIGKRGRAPTMKRTTSMTGINVAVPWPLDSQTLVFDDEIIRSPLKSDGHSMYSSTSTSAMISPRYYKRRGDFSGDHQRRLQESSTFLKTCGLCCRRLAHGRDIYMYMGDTAFCSEECRAQRIKQDERNEKSIQKSNNIESLHNHSDLTNESSKQR